VSHHPGNKEVPGMVLYRGFLSHRNRGVPTPIVWRSTFAIATNKYEPEALNVVSICEALQ
jgi:hypothetical protein